MKEFIEKLIERLEERVKENTNEDMSYKIPYFGLEIALKIVNQLAEEYNDGWISIDERFPENDNYILMSFANFSLPQIGRYEEDSEDGAFYLGDELETCVSQNLIVNAWQPLPESYQPKGE